MNDMSMNRMFTKYLLEIVKFIKQLLQKQLIQTTIGTKNNKRETICKSAFFGRCTFLLTLNQIYSNTITTRLKKSRTNNQKWA